MNLDTQYITYEILYNYIFLQVTIRSYPLKTKEEKRHEERETHNLFQFQVALLFILHICSSVDFYVHISTSHSLMCVSASGRKYVEVRKTFKCQYSPSSLSETKSLCFSLHPSGYVLQI